MTQHREKKQKRLKPREREEGEKNPETWEILLKKISLGLRSFMAIFFPETLSNTCTNLHVRHQKYPTPWPQHSYIIFFIFYFKKKILSMI